MQKAILCVLILIAVIMAPWLLAPAFVVLVAFVSAYGVVLMIAVGVIAVVGIAMLFVRKPKTLGDTMRERNKELNRKYMEDSRKRS
ncbi:hypothetical protein GIB64_02235 [Pseudomonas lactis]|uniref:hypothetical protein n=1 Tax=Pseudomonas TaxID=286 RepID=UPI000BB5BBCF|nr:MULTISPECIES: hypothetical protein [Pseudomonas]MBA5956236.1 hypothetical protein [Pseudomonas lactis]PRW80089.1 hypothetical protein C7A12_02625 [Pseudomonas fluorescens]PRW80864.1 hypothetical protein C7A13_06500 [Pseudomonas fluorescens]